MESRKRQLELSEALEKTLAKAMKMSDTTKKDQSELCEPSEALIREVERGPRSPSSKPENATTPGPIYAPVSPSPPPSIPVEGIHPRTSLEAPRIYPNERNWLVLRPFRALQSQSLFMHLEGSRRVLRASFASFFQLIDPIRKDLGLPRHPIRRYLQMPSHGFRLALACA